MELPSHTTSLPPEGSVVRWGDEDAIVVSHEDGSMGKREKRLVLYLVRTADVVSLLPNTQVEIVE